MQDFKLTVLRIDGVANETVQGETLEEAIRDAIAMSERGTIRFRNPKPDQKYAAFIQSDPKEVKKA